ncbi:MAG TPA: hypoxanthine phosphoribosyltransferase [Bacteroidales bacterium]|jgi:hypoxanthine phosphoribosyltransferase|nr:hypoxanthine phosphoribosyltransferase [Bacteroidales bacterium]
MQEIVILDKRFRESIPGEVINRRIDEMAMELNRDYAGREVVFLGILNGAFMFSSEIFKRIDLKARITFVKIASYRGTKSTGAVNQLIGLNEDLEDRDVVILEDIVDSGQTLESIVDVLILKKVHSIGIATLLLKPEAYSARFRIDYVGFKIPNDFVVGFGLDYDGFGRNLTSVYTLVH